MKPIYEQIELGDHQSISAFHYAKENFETPWHFHPQHELTYIEDSVGTKFIGDYVGSYVPGELVLLRSNLPHCWKNHAQPNRLAKSTVVQWNTKIYANVPELGNVFNMIAKAAKGIIFHTMEIQELIPKIQNLSNLNGEIRYIELLSLLVQLSHCRFSTLSESKFLGNISSEHNSRMARIHEFVGENFGRKIYLKDLANLVNMSEPSFSRFFSNMMGRPFFTFLNEYRINVACRMLIDTDRSVAEIGYFCGYESLPFFYKQFNKFNDSSPSRYRKKYKD